VRINTHSGSEENHVNIASTDYSNGRLEVFVYFEESGNSWVPFCYSYFDIYSAHIACQQLGYSGAYDYDTVQYYG